MGKSKIMKNMQSSRNINKSKHNKINIDIANIDKFVGGLGQTKTFVRTRGTDASKKYARIHTPVVCECGCIINRGLIYKHRKTKTHLRLMQEQATAVLSATEW